MKKILSFVIFSSIINVCFTFAQVNNVRTINIEDAVSLALENNISLQRNKISLDALEKANKYSWNSVSPSLNVSGSYNNALETQKQSMAISASVGIKLSPSVYTSIQTAKLNYEQGLISYEDAARTVDMNVRNSYYQILYAKENILLYQRNLDTAKKRYELNLDKYNKGQLSELDLLSAQYSYESIIPSLESLQISFENSVSTFKQILGIAQNEQIEFIGNLDDYLGEFDFQLAENLDESPSVKLLNSKLESAKNQLLATRFSAYGPSINLSYNYGLSDVVTQGVGTGWNTSQQIGLSVSIPLDGYLPWSSGALSVSSQKGTIEDLKLQLEDKKTSLSIEIQNSAKKIMQAQSQLEIMQKNVDLAQKKYDMTQTAYNHGSKDFLTLQSAEDSLLDAKIKLMSQKITLINEVLSLENTLGVPFGFLMGNNPQEK